MKLFTLILFSFSMILTGLVEEHVSFLGNHRVCEQKCCHNKNIPLDKEDKSCCKCESCEMIFLHN